MTIRAWGWAEKLIFRYLNDSQVEERKTSLILLLRAEPERTDGKERGQDCIQHENLADYQVCTEHPKV